jgi:hypothetical protein
MTANSHQLDELLKINSIQCLPYRPIYRDARLHVAVMSYAVAFLAMTGTGNTITPYVATMYFLFAVVLAFHIALSYCYRPTLLSYSPLNNNNNDFRPNSKQVWLYVIFFGFNIVNLISHLRLDRYNVIILIFQSGLIHFSIAATQIQFCSCCLRRNTGNGALLAQITRDLLSFLHESHLFALIVLFV